MRYVLLSLFLIVIPIHSINAQNSAADLGVAAIGLVVSDITASESFYTDIVGMKATGGFNLNEVWSNDAGAAHGRPFSVKTFKMVDGPSSTVLKLAYFDSVPARPEQSGMDSYAGVNYITLSYNAEGFKAVVERLKKNEIPIEGWVKRESYQLLFIKDPDGVYLELIGPN